MPHKLLLADDSITIQRVVELTFAGEDVEVVAVGDGEQAIARIPVERPDVVLADIAMPRGSGYDVSAFVKKHAELSHVPVLLLAGAFEPVDEARVREARCDGVLVKPFEPHQLIAKVRELLAPAADVKGAAQAPIPSERRAPTPAAPPPAVSPDVDDMLDDYFERLDAAFASMGHKSAVSPMDEGKVGDDGGLDVELPTVDDLLGATVAGSFAFEAPAPTPPDVIAEAFGAVLSEFPATAIADTPSGRDAHDRLVTELVNELTPRVMARLLAPEAVRAVVAELVSEVVKRVRPGYN